MSKYLIKVKSEAVPLSNNMYIFYPLSGETSKLTLPSVNPKTYNIVGGRILFVDEYLNVFAIPLISGIKAILVSNNYRKEDSLEVPFLSQEAYPLEYKEKWEALLAEMRATI